LVKSTEHKAPRYIVFSAPLFPVPLRPKYLPEHRILEHLQPMFLPRHKNRVSHPYKTRGKITVLHILIFIFLDSKLEDLKFCTQHAVKQRYEDILQ